ncbi:MAG: cytochrome P450, partial [Myxococcota bacterium]
MTVAASFDDPHTLPSGPVKSPVRTTWRVLSDPFGLYSELAERYGDPFTLRTVRDHFVMTGDPELVRQIFAMPGGDTLPFATEAMVPAVGEHSLLTMHGAAHTRARKLMMPAFHGKVVRALGEVIDAVARRHISRVPEGGCVVFRELGADISLEVIVRVIFGVTQEHAVRRVLDATREVLESMRPSLMFFDFTRVAPFGLGPWARFQRALRALDDLLYAEIRARREDPTRGEDDILAMMMASVDEHGTPLSAEELRDELITLLVAGHETTATALAWGMYHVLCSPEIVRKLRSERSQAPSATPTERARLPYLDAVVKETLRLYPIIPDVPRKITAPMQLGDYTLPAGVCIAAVSGLTHHDPELYPEPMTFRPERFLERTYKP